MTDLALPYAVMLTCGTCHGHYKVLDPEARKMVVCPDCNGVGRVPDTTATDDLISGLSSITPDAAEILVWLASHPDELNAWLAATGHLQATSHAVRSVPRDADLGPWQDGYVAPGTTEVVHMDAAGPHGRQLFTVAGA